MVLLSPSATHLPHLSCCQGHKVVNCFGDSFPKHSDDDSSDFVFSDLHVKVHLKGKLIQSHKQLKSALCAFTKCKLETERAK